MKGALTHHPAGGGIPCGAVRSPRGTGAPGHAASAEAPTDRKKCHISHVTFFPVSTSSSMCGRRNGNEERETGDAAELPMVMTGLQSRRRTEEDHDGNLSFFDEGHIKEHRPDGCWRSSL